MIDWAKLQTGESIAAAALAQAKADGLAALVAWSQDVTAAITGPVPLAEMLSWTAKETAARAVLAGRADPSESRLIGIEATVSKADPADLATRIVANADAYRDAIATLTALRLEAVKVGQLAETPEAVWAAVAAAKAAWASLR
jgi:hypothetical protein